MNTDQGAQLTSEAWIEEMKRREGLKISMDGTGRWVDNVFIEWLCFGVINLNLLIADVVKKSCLDIEGDKIRVEKNWMTESIPCKLI